MTCDEAAKAKSDQLHVPIHCEAPSERRGFSLLSALSSVSTVRAGLFAPRRGVDASLNTEDWKVLIAGERSKAVESMAMKAHGQPISGLPKSPRQRQRRRKMGYLHSKVGPLRLRSPIR